MADEPGNENDPDRLQDAPVPTPQESVEAKRLLARRRFLLGGATAVSVLFTATRVNAHPITATLCTQRVLEDFGFDSGAVHAFIRNNFGYFIDIGNDCDFIPCNPAPPPPAGATSLSAESTTTTELVMPPPQTEEERILQEWIKGQLK